MKVFRKGTYVFVSLMVLLLIFSLSGDGKRSNEADTKGIHYVSAYPGRIVITQPDNTTLGVFRVGDEIINYTRTIDGYTILPDARGFYYYARCSKDGDLVISDVRVSNWENRTNSEANFLAKTKKSLEYSLKQKKEKKEKWGKSGKGNRSNLQFGPIDQAFPSTGTRNMLVILAGFSDKSFVLPKSSFENIMNGTGNSFKRYYQDNSYDRLNVTTTVVGPYNVNMTMSAADANTRDYVARAIDAAENDGIDFSLFDNNNDGQMDALYVIHAGYGEEAGAPSNTIWSHSWDLSSYARNYDGVRINGYATSPELRGASGSTITAIGVICHEFGHNIGVPDYYDTDGSGSGGSAWDLGKWDVMAGGSWNNNGDTPSQHNMYTKMKLGWSTPTVLSSAATGRTLGNTMENNQAYRVNTATANEYFILENRQKIGWDQYIPGNGMLIFHIDANFIDGLSGNTVNASPTHQGVDVEEADNVKTSATYAADPFPGTGNKTSFTDSTTPNAKSWSGVNTGKPITNITESSGVIRFDFMSGGTGSSYCTSSGSSQTYEWIKNVQVGSLNNASGASPYTDYTAKSLTANKGASVAVTLTPGFAGSAYNEYWAVFVDYNHDGDFSDAGETVFTGSGKSNVTGSFTVSTAALTGATRMRVSMKYGSTPTPCETFTEGEVEDYTINIQTGGGSDPIAAALDNAGLTFTLSGNLNMVVTTSDYNYGGSSVTAPAALADRQSSTMETVISGKTSVSFYWKVSSEANYDFLRFYIDGVLQDEIAGTVNWTQKSYSISSGSHTLRWTYSKDDSVSSGSDTGWVDRLVLN